MHTEEFLSVPLATSSLALVVHLRYIPIAEQVSRQSSIRLNALGIVLAVSVLVLFDYDWTIVAVAQWVFRRGDGGAEG